MTKKTPSVFNILNSVFYLQLITLISLIILLLAPTKVTATEQSDFKTHINSEYKVNNLGSTTVTHNFTLTNLTPAKYISKYAIQTSYPELDNVTVTNNNQLIEANVVTNNNVTSIAIEFPDEVVGQSKQRKFTISYKTPDIAIIAGKVLEINIPKLAQQDTSTTHDIEIITPKTFGPPVRVTPLTFKAREETDAFTTSFEEINGQPISAFFGHTQVFSMNLRYHLENSSSATGKVQIAIPPDTAYQKIRYHSMEPPTNELKRDRDGNWIATYEVPAQTTSTVNLVADVLLSLDPFDSYLAPQPLNEHMQKQEFWELTAPLVTQAAQQETHPKAINDFVAKTLTYSFDNTQTYIERQGAEEALENPTNAVCQEFTDAFIAIARSNSIPSRRLTGYAYTQNDQLRPLSLEGDILHAWPEYYDADLGIWKPIDPTWQNTTGGIDYFSQFDLNHIVFAINGIDSSKPYPVGSFKPGQVETKDIEVRFGTTFPESTPSISTTYAQKKIFGIPLPGWYETTVSNNTGEAWYSVLIEQKSRGENDIISPGDITLSELLPFQEHTFTTYVLSNNTWKFDKGSIISTISINTQEPLVFEQEITSLPNAFKYFTNQKALTGLVVGAIIITLGTGSILVFRQRR